MSAIAPDKTPRTAAPEVRRRQLIAATIDAIAEDGLSGTTLAGVARRAGLSTGLVNFHFRSKDILLAETLDHLAQELRAAWRDAIAAPGLAPAQKLTVIVDAHFDPAIIDRRKIAVWFAFFGETQARAAYRRHTTDIDMERLDASTALCREIALAGGYASADPEGIGRALEALFDGFWLNMLVYPHRFSHDDAKAQIMAYLAGNFPRDFG